jgi:hypothetical protein
MRSIIVLLTWLAATVGAAAYTYTLTDNGLPANAQAVVRSDGAIIPVDAKNLDWAAYIGWLAVPNTPSPARAAPPPSLPPTVAVVSTGTPSLSGTYLIGSEQTGDMTGVILGLVVNGTFPNGGTSYGWPDAGSTLHTFTISQFKAFSSGVLAYVAAWKQAKQGVLPYPTSPVTIP